MGAWSNSGNSSLEKIFRYFAFNQIFEKNNNNKETFSLQTIADLSFLGCITNLVFYTLLSGKRAKSLLENLKKQYRKKKTDLKKVKKSVSSLKDTQSVKEALARYIFLSQLHDFTKLHLYKSNMIWRWFIR